MCACEEDPVYTGVPRGATGSTTGKLRIVRNLSDAEAISAGDIVYLPADGLRSDNIPLFYTLVRNGVSAVLCEYSGKTDHGVLLTNELSVICVSDIPLDIEAYQGCVMTVDGNNIFEGAHETVHIESDLDPATIPSTSRSLKLNLGFPEVVTEHPELAAVVDGVGFMRLEFVMLDILDGVHPEAYIDRHGSEELARQITDRIHPVLNHFDEKPVWIRTNDFSVSQLLRMERGNEYEEPESHSMMGWRGIARAVDSSPLFDVEIEVFQQIVAAGHRNIGVFPPMTRFKREYIEWKSRFIDAGLNSLSYGVMVETPSAALTFEEFVDDVDFMIFGSNDLTQFTLAIDRDNEKLQSKYDETETAVKKLMKRVLDICSEHDIESSIGGKAASNPDLLRTLLNSGISGVSVNPDVQTIQETASQIEEWERKQNRR